MTQLSTFYLIKTNFKLKTYTYKLRLTNSDLQLTLTMLTLPELSISHHSIKQCQCIQEGISQVINSNRKHWFSQYYSPSIFCIVLVILWPIQNIANWWKAVKHQWSVCKFRTSIHIVYKFAALSLGMKTNFTFSDSQLDHLGNVVSILLKKQPFDF